MYPTHDVNFLGSEEYNAIPVKSDYFPGPSHNCFEYADFDARYYEWVQGFEKEGAMAGVLCRYVSGECGADDWI